MLKKSNHFKRLIQPLPIFAAFICRLLNFDIEMSMPKQYHLNQKGTVPKMKLSASSGDKKEGEALKEKVMESLDQFPTIELKRGYLQIAKAKK